jgi:alpha-D-xyloside xylohydrolase
VYTSSSLSCPKVMKKQAVRLGNHSKTVGSYVIFFLSPYGWCDLDGQVISSIPYARSFAQYFIGTQEATGKMYPWLHQQAIDEGFRNLTGTGEGATSCEYMSLTRSTFAGGQRFCSYLWSGDTDSRFDVLLQQITSGVSVAASGISSWTLDIGGFAGLNIDTAEVSPSLHR